MSHILASLTETSPPAPLHSVERGAQPLHRVDWFLANAKFAENCVRFHCLEPNNSPLHFVERGWG
jgi:hypothetical protein